MELRMLVRRDGISILATYIVVRTLGTFIIRITWLSNTSVQCFANFGFAPGSRAETIHCLIEETSTETIHCRKEEYFGVLNLSECFFLSVLMFVVSFFV
jgi:hypothetical protein